MPTHSIIQGVDLMERNLRKYATRKVQQAVVAVEKTGVAVINAAKRDHQTGAHAAGRYENQTTELTNSMASQLHHADDKEIVVQCIANREYAADVELGTPTSRPYPYMFPALSSSSDDFKRFLISALKKR